MSVQTLQHEPVDVGTNVVNPYDREKDLMGVIKYL
jgi:hypothetical protein